MASEGKTALELCRARNPQLILLDVSMPLFDGWEVCRILKTDESTRGIRILVISAHAMQSDRDKAFACGTDNYLATPIEPRVVLNLIRQIIGEP